MWEIRPATGLLPKTKELAQLESDHMMFQWNANQQGVVNYQPHGDDHLWDPIPCKPTAVDSSVDSLGNLIVRGNVTRDMSILTQEGGKPLY